MEYEIYNPLLNRREIKMEISDSVPPSMENARKIVAEKFSVVPEHIHVEKIAGKFGSKSFTIIANIYPSSLEREKFHLRNKKEKKEEAKK